MSKVAAANAVRSQQDPQPRGLLRVAERIRANNPDNPPAYLGPRYRPGTVEFCVMDGMGFTTYWVHAQTVWHKRAMRRARRGTQG